MSKLKQAERIYMQLSLLEDLREEARIENKDSSLIEYEINKLRENLKNIMNSDIPVYDPEDL